MGGNLENCWTSNWRVIHYFKHESSVTGISYTRTLNCKIHGPLTRYAKLRVAHAPGMPGTFSPPSLVIDPDMHHGTCLTHVPWCMSGSITSGSLWNRWRGKRSRHSRRMRNPQFCVSGKRPMTSNTCNYISSDHPWKYVSHVDLLRKCFDGVCGSGFRSDTLG